MCVGVILLTTRILLAPDYIRPSTDCGAKSRPDGGVLLCESSMQVVSNVNRILAREKDNEDSTTSGKKI